MNQITTPQTPQSCLNFDGKEWFKGQGKTTQVFGPYDGAVIGEVTEATSKDIDRIVESALVAQKKWELVPIKERTLVMFKLREILLQKADEIAHTISLESGKTLLESKAGLMKGIEVLEFAISIQNLDAGSKLEVSRGVSCEYKRIPLGVVAGITPFNFPAMVPMWMLPIAITLGNAFIWKPSDKTPLTATLITNAFMDAGLPAGVLTVLQGAKDTVESLLDHKDIKAIGFVGSTPVAQSVYRRGTQSLKRMLTLGGAKNHIILLPDANPELTGKGITDSFTGCAGQRCMAASVLLAVGQVDSLIEDIVQNSKSKKLCQDMGAIITQESKERISKAIDKAVADGAKILLDGRSPEVPSNYKNGYWLGPTILDNVKPGSEAACSELFGPVLSIVRCKNLSEALEIENSNPYGNAASVFTQNGAFAEEVAQKARAGMIGVNIGVPVPREPFSFGGLYESKFGQGDITGPQGIEFWTHLKKVTKKWNLQHDQNWMS